MANIAALLDILDALCPPKKLIESLVCVPTSFGYQSRVPPLQVFSAGNLLSLTVIY
jgi:hypothetical protein